MAVRHTPLKDNFFEVGMNRKTELVLRAWKENFGSMLNSVPHWWTPMTREQQGLVEDQMLEGQWESYLKWMVVVPVV
jgi:hypothetical protein